MAEEIIFKTSVDTGNTANDLKKISDELKKVENTTMPVKALSQTFDDLNKRVESGTLTMRESTQAIKQYQTIALQAGRESPIGKEALQRAGDLKDKLGDLKTEITNLGTDGARMKAALQLGSTVTAGYGALTGVQALLGKENENLTKSMVKLQAVQAVLASLEEIRSALEKESFLMQKAKTAQTWLMTTAQAAYATVVGTSTGALKIFKIALASTGIGLLIVALGAVATNFDKVKSKSMEVGAQFKNMYQSFAQKYPQAAKSIEAALKIAFFPITITISAMQKLYDMFTGTTEASRELARVEKENHDKHIRQLDQEQKAREENLKGLDRKIALLEAEGKSTIKLREEKIKLQKQEAEANLAFAEYMKGRMKGNEVFEQSFTDMVSAAKDSLNNIKVEEAKLKQDRDQEAKDNQQKAREAQDKANALSEERKRKAQEEADHKSMLNQAWLDSEANTGAILSEQEALKTEEQIAKDELERQREEELSAFRIGLWEHQLAEEKRISDEEVKARRESNDKKVKNAEDLSNALNQLVQGVFEVSNAYGKQDDKSKEQRARKQFKVAKAMSLAVATIDGIKTTMAAFRNGMENPIPLLGPATAAIYAAGAAVAAGANISKISRTQFDSGAGGDLGSVAAPPTVPNTPNPQLTNAQTTLTSGIGSETNSPKQPSGKVFVVDSEITAKQNQTQNTLSIATVG